MVSAEFSPAACLKRLLSSDHLNRNFHIADVIVGQGRPAFIIAEAGVNHMGSTDMACELIRAARQAGADCVKFQTFKAERVATASAPKAMYQTLTTDPQESQIEMLRKLELKESDYKRLMAVCRQEKIIFMSTPYNEEDVDFLVAMEVPAFKAASIHLVEPEFLKLLARTGKPLIVSTGMATLDEVATAVDAIRQTGNENFVLLQCTTNYPSRIEESNLNAMHTMHSQFDCLIGYSDHTQSNIACIASIALGACVIEKHFTLDNTLPGPDQLNSETPGSFRKLVEDIRATEKALGSADKTPAASEMLNMHAMRRSITARRSIRGGQRIEASDLTCRRPADGIRPDRWTSVVGRTARRDIAQDTQITQDDLTD